MREIKNLYMFKYICVRMNMENETKQTKAYIYFVYFLYMQLAHFPHIFSKQFCLQFACSSAW